MGANETSDVYPGSVTDQSWIDLDARVAELASTSVPDANLPLATSVLQVDKASSGTCLLVSFPAGWERGPGSYTCAEHAVVIDGSIELDGTLWDAGSAFFIPAGAQRTRTFSPGGALAIAWFAGVPRWIGGGEVAGAPGSSSSWVGDGMDTSIASDVVDVTGRSWRHVAAGDSSVSEELLRYAWNH